MRTRFCLSIATLLACATSLAAPPMGLSGGGGGTVSVVMTAVTLADDCGASAQGAPAARRAESDSDSKRESKAVAYRCRQSSMQLNLLVELGGEVALRVKKVELFDDKGAQISELTARSPTVWSEKGAYQAWDEKIVPGQRMAVSYALSQPNWGSVTNRSNKTYLVKAVVSVAGVDLPVEKSVQIAAPPTSLPPDVET